MASSETIPDQNSSDKRQDRQRFNESRRDSSTNDSDPSKVMTLEHERSSVDLRETEKGEESQRIGDLDREETSPRSSGNIKLNKEFLGPGESSGSEDDLDASLDDVERSDEDQPGSASKPKTERQLRLESEKAERAIAREGQKKMRHAREENLKSRRKEVDAGKVSDSIKRFGYLLGQTDLFRHFCDLKAQREPEFAKLLAESEKVSNNKAKQKNNQRKRKTEMEEDAELLAAEKRGDKDGDGDTINDDEPFMFTESPSYVKGGKMRDYQIQGLNWMISLFHNGINGILADEMGLGKTLQTISFLGYLKHHRSLSGPHLVVVPKSTLDNWNREFNFWVPGFNIVSLKGDKDERAEICQKKVLTQDFDIILTTYEICLREKSSLKKVAWEYIIIDEAHRIKNVDSMLSQIIRAFQSRARLLITGTPLQNNLQELWALLNFLLPDVFSSSEDFDAWFSRERTGNNGDSQSDAENSVVKQLHKVLRPFLLRRVKSDVEKSLLPKKEINVYVGMTEMQRKWYKMILEKDIDAVNGVTGKKEGKTRLMNVVMQLRKCCNHPYLFDGAESPPFTTDEHLVYNSGKMIILDKLLKTMRAKGSRVLIFSQMSRVLDILEDYCVFRQYEYCRIDGSTAHEERVGAIDEYNKEGSSKFIFLLTTRAGGLGINLTTADIVVLFDSDWNPQADLQAMDRAHRIGQKKQVYVFRFVTENAVEEKVLERAAQKLRLDQLVIQQGRASVAQKGQTKEDLVDMIQHGAEKIINSKENMLINDDIESIIKRGEERTAELNEKYSRLDFDDLANFKTETNTQQWEGENYAANGQAKKKIVLNWIEPAKRERKMNYSENISFRDLMRGGPVVPKKKKVPKKINTSDWQFYPPRFIELQDKADLYFKKTNGIKAELPERDESDNTNPEDLEKEKQELQAEIDNAEPLTEAELEEKTEMQSLGFETWSRRDFLNFIKGCELNGRDAYDLIANEIETKNKEEVQEYSEVFWQRYEEIEDHARFISKIEQAEMKRKKADRTEELLKEKIESVKLPMQNLKIHYLNQTKGKSYSEEEDRFLLVQLHRHGIGREEVYDLIKKDIVESPLFRFDWFIKSRTPQEIMRRCNTLVQLIVKELDPEDAEELMRKRAVKAKKDNEADEGEICTTTTATATSNSNKTNGFFNSNSTNGNGISNGAPGKAAGKSRKRRADEANSTENGNSTADLDESRASTPTTQRKKSRTSSNK